MEFHDMNHTSNNGNKRILIVVARAAGLLFAYPPLLHWRSLQFPSSLLAGEVRRRGLGRCEGQGDGYTRRMVTEK